MAWAAWSGSELGADLSAQLAKNRAWLSGSRLRAEPLATLVLSRLSHRHKCDFSRQALQRRVDYWFCGSSPCQNTGSVWPTTFCFNTFYRTTAIRVFWSKRFGQMLQKAKRSLLEHRMVMLSSWRTLATGRGATGVAKLPSFLLCFHLLRRTQTHHQFRLWSSRTSQLLDELLLSTLMLQHYRCVFSWFLW